MGQTIPHSLNTSSFSSGESRLYQLLPQGKAWSCCKSPAFMASISCFDISSGDIGIGFPQTGQQSESRISKLCIGTVNSSKGSVSSAFVLALARPDYAKSETNYMRRVFMPNFWAFFQELLSNRRSLP
jgi:hypothetical protein